MGDERGMLNGYELVVNLEAKWPVTIYVSLLCIGETGGDLRVGDSFVAAYKSLDQ